MSKFRRQLIASFLGEAPAPPEPVLPYDHEVEYLQSDGNQWIELPVYASEATDAIEITIKRTNNTAQQRICCPSDGDTTIFNIYANGNNRIGYHNGGWRAATNDNWSYIGTEKHTIKIDYYRNLVWIDTASWNKSGGNSTAVASGKLTIIKQYDTQPSFQGLLYGVRFWRSGNLMYDLQPVRKNGVGYLYDKIGGQLYGNQGSGNFTVGYDKLSNLSDYTQLDFIKNTGNGYLNTMLALSNETTLHVKFKYNGTLSNYPAIFGTRTGTSNRFDLYINSSNPNFLYSRGSIVATASNTQVDNNLHIVENTPNGLIFDEDEIEFTSSSFTIGQPLLLFSAPNTSSGGYSQFYSKTSIYEVKAYNGNVLVRDFVPVLHPSGVYGMFDKVENKFYESATSVALSGGNDS